jgi:hypothetical protein
MDNPANAIGYCAVILPKIDQWQGYWIVDDPTLSQSAVQAQIMAMASGSHPLGVLQAMMVEASLHNNHTGVGVAALALKGMMQTNYFVVIGDKQSAGTVTSAQPLRSTNIDDARAEIDNLPEVKEIKQRLINKVGIRDGLGRMKATH